MPAYLSEYQRDFYINPLYKDIAVCYFKTINIYQNSENVKFIMNPSSKPIWNGGAVPPPSLKLALNHPWTFTDRRTIYYYSLFDTFYLNLSSFRLFINYTTHSKG